MRQNQWSSTQSFLNYISAPAKNTSFWIEASVCDCYKSLEWNYYVKLSFLRRREGKLARNLKIVLLFSKKGFFCYKLLPRSSRSFKIHFRFCNSFISFIQLHSIIIIIFMMKWISDFMSCVVHVFIQIYLNFVVSFLCKIYTSFKVYANINNLSME